MSGVRAISVALLHHPVVDRGGDIVTTAVTNLDVHDIARSSHTFGVAAFYVVHPIAAQRELVSRIVNHWVDGSGAKRIPDRKPAMEGVRLVSSLDDALEGAGAGAELWVTSASDGGQPLLTFPEARAQLRAPGPPLLVCFGTGWGLSESVMNRATARLVPIRSPRPDGYNHLSVRAAVAITLDRLLSEA